MPAHHPIHPHSECNPAEIRCDSQHTQTSKIHTHSQHELYCALQRQYLASVRDNWGDSSISSHRNLVLTWNNDSLVYLIGIVKKWRFWHCFFNLKIIMKTSKKWTNVFLFFYPFKIFLIQSIQSYSAIVLLVLLYEILLMNEWQNILLWYKSMTKKQLCKNSH